MDRSITCGLGVVDGVDFEAMVEFSCGSMTIQKVLGRLDILPRRQMEPILPLSPRKTIHAPPEFRASWIQTQGRLDLRERRFDCSTWFGRCGWMHTAWLRGGCTCRSSTKIFATTHVFRSSIQLDDGGGWCFTRKTDPTAWFSCLRSKTWKPSASRWVHGSLCRSNSDETIDVHPMRSIRGREEHP